MIKTKNKTLNQVLNQIADKLIQQGEQCLDETGCVCYSNNKGQNCPVGYLLPDGFLGDDPISELVINEKELGENSTFIHENIELMNQIQFAHDQAFTCTSGQIRADLKLKFIIGIPGIPSIFDYPEVLGKLSNFIDSCGVKGMKTTARTQISEERFRSILLSQRNDLKSQSKVLYGKDCIKSVISFKIKGQDDFFLHDVTLKQRMNGKIHTVNTSFLARQ